MNYTPPDPRTTEVVRVLGTYGVLLTPVATIEGPRTTAHQVRLRDGVTLASVENRLGELACALEVDACTMRVERGRIYIDVPRDEADVPCVSDFPEAPDGHFLAGVAATGAAIYVCVERLPHCIVAGSSGAGKTHLMRVMLDTLRGDWHRVVLDPKGTCDLKALGVLDWSGVEMVALGLGLVYDEFEFRLHRPGKGGFFADATPVLLVVDEFQAILGDKTQKRQLFEILSMGRSLRIHCVIATQAPSAAIIGNEMRVNAPSRIVLRVASASDSRVALGEGGAEKLLGAGDAYLRYDGRITRIQVPQLD